MKFRPDTSNLQATADQAAADIRQATDRVSESAEAIGSLAIALAAGVIFALALAAAAYVRASRT